MYAGFFQIPIRRLPVRRRQAFRRQSGTLSIFPMLCPGKLRGIQAEVKAVCDRLDYQGSPIYDEYPDRVAMEQLSRGIARRVSEQLSEEENTALYTAEVRSYSGTVITGNPAPRVRAMETAVPGEAMETGEEGDTESLHMEDVNGRGGPKGPGPARRPWGPPPPPNHPWGPPPPPPNHPWGPPLPPPNHPGGHGNPDWGDIAALLLFSEIQRRRCQSRGCR